MKIAIIGSGISGLTAAYRLHERHDITVFEAGSHIGGHTNTRDVTLPDGSQHAVDTGFIVFNHETYPEFLQILRELDVATLKTDMSFSVANRRTGLEFSGSGLRGLFAQKRNWLNPAFLGMLRDISRFKREMQELLEADDPSISLGEFTKEHNYGPMFWENFLAPMGAAIWSSPDGHMGEFPAAFFARFFHNHRFLDTEGQPQWYVIKGGSREYVRKMIRPFEDRIHLNRPVVEIERHDAGVTIRMADGEVGHFDKVILATHSDQALKMLRDPSSDELRILSAFPYQKNLAILHTDTSILPRSRNARASWNHLVSEGSASVSVTYDMTRLQSLQASERFLVTLNNRRDIDPKREIERIEYMHPLFTCRSAAAQREHHVINGVRNTHYCGAYWRYGFHEDGVVSALQAIAPIEQAPSGKKVA